MIRLADSSGKSKQYYADPNVFQVIVEVLNKRERRLIENAQKAHQRLTQSFNDRNSNSDCIELSRLSQLGETIRIALDGLLFIVNHFNDHESQDFSTLNKLKVK